MATTVTVTWRVEGGNVANLLDVMNQTRIGRLTTEHAASSHGLPVVVLDDGTALGPKEVGELEAGEINPNIDDPGAAPYRPLTVNQLLLVEAARHAGYSVKVA